MGRENKRSTAAGFHPAAVDPAFLFVHHSNF
jgi:hypothetical protein